MDSFKEFTEQKQVVLESNQAIKKHLSHLEDLAIEYGKPGYYQFCEHVDSILRKIEGLKTSQDINLKVDGSMMILFGNDPRKEFKGKFFVSTKSGLSVKNPKINHSHQDINKNYVDEDLALKLRIIFTYLEPFYVNLDSNSIFQADVLFCGESDKLFYNIDGEKYLTFTPNTITYAIPVDLQSDLYSRVNSARVGIVIHEELKGKGTNNDQALILSPITRKVTGLLEACKGTRIFAEQSNVGAIKFNASDAQIQKIREHLSKSNEFISRVSVGYSQDVITDYLKIYLNKQVDLTDSGIFGSAARSEKFKFSAFLKGFNSFIKQRFRNEAKTKKTEKGSKSTISRGVELLKWVKHNKSEIEKILNATYHMIQVKFLLLKLFQHIESKLGKTFYQDSNGNYNVTSQEGYVFFIGDNHVKLVDRLVFSKLNRQNNRLT